MTHREATAVASAFTIKRFLRPESDVENNIIYFEYLLGTSSPPPSTISQHIWGYIIIISKPLRCPCAPFQIFSDQAEPKYASSMLVGDGERRGLKYFDVPLLYSSIASVGLKTFTYYMTARDDVLDSK